MELNSRLRRLMQEPSAREVWNLRGDLLQSGRQVDEGLWTLLENFYRYLQQLESSTTSREHSHKASLLDIGAVGGVVMENLMEADNPQERGQRLLSALLSEGLMVLATRQHVKAWEQELETVYRGAAWDLYDLLWQWSSRLQPDLPASQRRRLMELLLAPVLSIEVGGTVKAVLITRFYQLLIWSSLQSVEDLPRCK